MTRHDQFQWQVLYHALSRARAQRKHVILRVYLHYPGQPLRVPQFLLDHPIPLVTLIDGETSPQYDDPILLAALQQFIVALGSNYDGHASLAFVQLGLLGKWGEFHTYPDTGLLSDATKSKVMRWYRAAFAVTPLQVRNPDYIGVPGRPGTARRFVWFFDPGRRIQWRCHDRLVLLAASASFGAARLLAQ